MRKLIININEAYHYANQDIKEDLPICADARIVSCAKLLMERHGIDEAELCEKADIAREGIIYTRKTLEEMSGR